MNNKKVLGFLAALLILAAAGAGSYFYYQKQRSAAELRLEGTDTLTTPAGSEELSGFSIYYPEGDSLQAKERRVPRRSKQTTMAEAVLEEFFRGPGNGTTTVIPRDVKVLGVYRDAAQILYVDLSDELRRNFQGDALAEYLVLKGIYESLMTNIQDIQDVKILVEGKEIESMGGHLLLKFPLKATVSADVKTGKGMPGD